MSTQRVCVVTGATSGIGRAIAEALVRDGSRVIAVCRDPTRGAELKEELGAGAALDLVVKDLSSIAGCHAATEELLARCRSIDVVVHNAGVWPVRLELTGDGLERAFAVNALAPFLLNRLLDERLRQHRSRIVQVSAGLHVAGAVDPAKTPTGEDFHRIKSYANTKLWNLICTMELARRLRGTGVTVNAVHPGVVRTRLGEMTGVAGAMLKLVKLFWSTPEAGARAPVALASSDTYEGVSETYFDKLRPTQPAAAVRDRDLAHTLWLRTEELCRRRELRAAG